MYKNKKILILGGARSGVASALLLKEENKVTLTDLKPLTKEDEKKLNGVEIIITENQKEILDNSYDLVVKNPGIFPENEVLTKAQELKIPVLNEIEVSYNYLPKMKKIITITGSNGKTTTTLLIEQILNVLGYKTYVGGNIGIPLSSFVKNIEEDSVLILEVSDHQLLNFQNFKSDISVLTNIYETHIDYHKTFENYKKAKEKVFNNHDENSVAIINHNNQDSLDLTEHIKSKKIYFNDEFNYYTSVGIYINEELIIAKEEIQLVGTHNYENILAALLVAKQFNFDKEQVKEALKTFGGVEHRIEYVRTYKNVKFYNDSKSTNPTSTIVALKTFDAPIHLILGGLDRMQDFNEMLPYLNNVKYIYGVGEVEPRVKNFAEKNNINYVSSLTLNNVANDIKTKIEEYDVVLFSPASASLDQYKNFEIRGEEFKNIVNML